MENIQLVNNITFNYKIVKYKRITELPLYVNVNCLISYGV